MLILAAVSLSSHAADVIFSPDDEMSASPRVFLSASAAMKETDLSFVALPVHGEQFIIFRALQRALVVLKLDEVLLSWRPKWIGWPDQGNAMPGIRAATELPKSLGRVALKLGAMIARWRDAEEIKKVMYGGYAGVDLHLRIWKFSDEVRVAYYVIPQLGQEYVERLPNMDGRIINQRAHGFVGLNRLLFDLLQWPTATLGPELRAQLRQLPDGIEWIATIGVAAEFRTK